MSAADIKHFLVVYDITAGVAHVEPFGTDYQSAVAAYGEAEHKHRNDDDIEIVLLGSDSIDTLERTHSSYFELSEKHADQVVARELAEFGFR